MYHDFTSRLFYASSSPIGIFQSMFSVSGFPISVFQSMFSILGIPIGVFQSMFSVVAMESFKLQPEQNGYLMSYIGVLTMVGNLLHKSQLL